MAPQGPQGHCVIFYKEMHGLKSPPCSLSLYLPRLERKQLVSHSLGDHMLGMTRAIRITWAEKDAESWLTLGPSQWLAKHCLSAGERGHQHRREQRI